jgi:uncharacterized RDD family membrane protein YckC
VIGGTTTAPPTFAPGGDHFSIGTPRLGYGLRQAAEWLARGPLLGRLIVPDLPWIWAALGITFVLSLLINQIFDPPVRAAAQVVQARPLNTVLMGLLLVVVIGPALVVLAASVVGLLVVPFAVCAILAGWMVGKVGVTRAIGMRLLPETDPDSRVQSLRSFVIGFVIIAAAYAVPVLGLTTWGLISLFGLGATGLTFVERRRSARAATAMPSTGTTPAATGMHTAFEASGPLGDDPVAHVVVPSPDAAPAPVSPGATTLLPHAAFLDRAAAFAIDCLLMGVAIQVLGQNDDLYLFWLLVYHVAFWIWKATTLGGIICNLRVVRTNGEPLRPTDAVVRGLSSLFSIAALGIGCLWMIRDPNRQTWHDKIAGTYVVKVPKDWPL